MVKIDDLLPGAPDFLWNTILISLTILTALLLKYIVIPLLKPRKEPTKTFSVYRSSVRHLNKVMNVLFPVLLFNALMPFLRVAPKMYPIISHATEVVLIVCFAIVLIRIIRIIEDYLNYRFDYNQPDNLRARKARTQIQFIRKVLVAVVIVVTVAIVLLSFDNMQKIGTGLLTGVGLGGIIIGFAAQKSIGNLLAGFEIAFTQPFRIDDVLIVEGEWGRVEEINLTYVVVNIWDKRRLVLPIQYFIEKPFQNWTRTTAEILGIVYIYTDYTLPVDVLRKELTRVLHGHSLWDGKVDVLQVTDLKERTMELRALMSCRNSGEAWDLRCYVREKLINFIREHYPESLVRTRIDIRR